jgi:SNF2 family DNA or RNA helicase
MPALAIDLESDDDDDDDDDDEPGAPGHKVDGEDAKAREVGFLLGGDAPQTAYDRMSVKKKIKYWQKKARASIAFFEGSLTMSTKMANLLAILQMEIAENPRVKCLVFSQWTSMLTLVETILNKKMCDKCVPILAISSSRMHACDLVLQSAPLPC